MPKLNVSEPSPRQADLLGAIDRYVADKGYPPSRAELAKELGISTTRADAIARDCQKKGLLSFDPCTPRSLRLLKKGAAE